MKRFCVPCLLLLLLASAGADAGEAISPTIDKKAAKALAEADNAFARDLYGVLSSGDENLLFSPYSIQSALLLVREGAVGETAAQIDAALHVKGMARGLSYRALRDSLRPARMGDGYGKEARMRPTFELNVANAVWGQQRYFIKNTFLEPLRDEYDARLLRVDFRNAVVASRVVNAWAARQTRNKIRGVISPDAIPPLTRLILANAVYFKAAWRDEFHDGYTKPEVFHGPGGTEKKVPLMRRQDRYGYAEIEGVQVLSLPYLHGETRMMVYLPRAKDGLTSLETKYVAGKLAGAWEAMKVLEVNVKFPKFEFASQYRLNDALSKLGISDAFDQSAADFSRVSDEKELFLGTVVHKAFISVDEEGTEAAAVTAMMMPASAAPGTPENPIVFRADHPFLFEIVHGKTGATLFTGRVIEP